MSTLAAPPMHAPLSALTHADREQVIAVLTQRLPPDEAVTVLAALAGSREEVRALPMLVQERAQAALLDGLEPGLSVIAVSKLGIGLLSDEEYLEEVLTHEERADTEFRRRVEAEAQRRGIPRWLVAIRLRHQGKTIDEVATLVEQTLHQR